MKDDTDVIPLVIDVPSLTPPTGRRLPAPVRRLVSVLTSAPDLGTYLGTALVAAGFLTIVVAWHDMARLEHAELQLPYLASGAGIGLALVISGLAVIAITVRTKDTAARRRQLVELTSTLRAVEDGLRQHRISVESALATVAAPRTARRSR